MKADEWDRLENLFCDEKIPFSFFFNYFDISDIEGFREFVEDEINGGA